MERFIADDLAARNVSLNTIYFLDIFGSFSTFLWKFLVEQQHVYAVLYGCRLLVSPHVSPTIILKYIR